jgi:hypothetical protein
LKEAGYNSNDERGTADAVHGMHEKGSRKSGKKRKKRSAAPEPGPAADVDGLEDEPSPAEKKFKKVLESDDE